MIGHVESNENAAVSVTTAGTSQEKNSKNVGVIITIPTAVEKDDLVPKPVPGAGSTSTEKDDQATIFTPEPQSNSTENSPFDSTVFEQFFHVSTGHSSFQESCPTLAAHCGGLWEILDSPYSIPLWLLLTSAPVSAAVVGALHMHSCPAAANLAILIFSMGLLYCAAFFIKICRILLKIFDGDECCKPSFRTSFGVIAVLTIGLCVTESVYFWRMKSTQESGTLMYCDPQLIAFAFWWNCFMWFGIVILFFCQG